MVVTTAVLKSYFAEGSFPTGDQFDNFIDTMEAMSNSGLIVAGDFDANTGQDENGDALPTPSAENLGLKYRVSNSGAVDLGAGVIELVAGDLIVVSQSGEDYLWLKVADSTGAAQTGAMKFYSTFDAGTQLDGNGEPLPTAAEEYEGRQYVVSAGGLVDLGLGEELLVDGDIITCIFFGGWQWSKWGNVYSTPPLNSGTDGSFLGWTGEEWAAMSILGDIDGLPSVHYLERKLYKSNANVVLDFENGTANDDEGDLSLLFEERVGVNDTGENRFSWFDELKAFDNSSVEVFSAGEMGVFFFKLYDGPALSGDKWLGIREGGEVFIVHPEAELDKYERERSKEDTTSALGGSYSVNFGNRPVATLTVASSNDITLNGVKTNDYLEDLDDNEIGGGYYVLHLVNHVEGNPVVFDFNNTDFKLTTGTSVTVGEASDSYKRLTTFTFYYYAGKFREIARTAGTGTLLN